MNISKQSLLAALLAAFAFGPAMAEKGHGKHGRGHDDARVVERHHGKHEGKRHGRNHDDARRGDRVVIVDQDRRFRARACPPGLEKKNNGCMPPGQAKRIVVGQPLPSGAIFSVPQPVLSTLPPPPLGHRYAVINNQIVLVSDTNNIVVDIIRSLLG